MTAATLVHTEPILDTESLFLKKKQDSRIVYSTDPEIVNAIRRGDQAAFEKTFRKYYDRLCNYANGLLREADEAEEVVQTVFLAIWEKRSELEITLSLKSYLYRAVHNHCLNRFKHASVREVHREYTQYYVSQSYESVTEEIHANELEERIESAVSNLPEQCQIAFRMSRFQDLKYQEIADRLGISVKTVENQIGKALKILRTALADYLPVLIVFVKPLIEQLFRSQP